MSVMYVATLDILTEKGGFNPEAARAIGEAIDLEIARSRDASATKEDVSECRRALRDEIGAQRAETDRNFAIVRGELKEAISALRAELKEEISGLRTELKADISSLRTELKEDISGLRAELKQNMGELRAESKVSAQTNKAELVRWVFVFIMGQFAMLLGVLYFFIRYFK
jgi:hypothetical protein